MHTTTWFRALVFVSLAYALICLAISDSAARAENSNSLSEAISSYYAGETSKALAILDNSLETAGTGTRTEFNALFWSLYFRTEQRDFSDPIWKHLDRFQKFPDDSTTNVKLAVGGAVLSVSYLNQGDWQKAYEQASSCIKSNANPVGDTVLFVPFCLSALVEAAQLTNNVHEAVHTASWYTAKIIRTNRLYKSDVCRLLAVLNRVYALKSEWRKSFFALSVIDENPDICLGNVSARAAAFLTQLFDTLLDMGAVPIIKHVLDRVDVDKPLEDTELSPAYRSRLQWSLLNAYALVGDVESAQNIVSAETVQEWEDLARDQLNLPFPYAAIRRALLAFSSLRSGDVKEFERRFGDLNLDANRLPSFGPAVKMMAVEARLLSGETEEAKGLFKEFVDEFIEQKKLERIQRDAVGMRLRGYDRLVADHSLSQFIRMINSGLDEDISSGILQIYQALVAPEARFGLERAQIDTLSATSPISKTLRAITRSNAKAADVVSWEMLQDTQEFLSGERDPVRDRVEDSDVRNGNLVASAFRELASMEREFGQFIANELKEKVVPVQPLGIPKIQKLLHENEGMLIVFAHGDSVVRFCILKEEHEVSVKRVDLKKFSEDLKMVDASLRATGGSDDLSDLTFPFDASQRLFNSLFDRERKCLNDIDHLFFVPHPGMTLIPFNALLHSRDSNNHHIWFQDLTPHSFLTSVPALEILRQRKSLFSKTRQNYLGISNPDFSTSRSLADAAPIVVAQSLYPTRGGRGSSDFQGLPQLPDADEEVEAIAALFPEKTVRLISGEQATETTFRKLDLHDYRFISIATHALVAGEFDGLREPAIALVPGNPETSRSDGLLTASEVNQMTISADLVFLSACNTAAGDGGFSAPGLSGLTDSMLAAGATSVAATQWAVDSAATKSIAVETMRLVVGSREGAAYALQKAAALLRQSKGGLYAHPKYWAGFLIVGDGGRATSQDREELPSLETSLNIHEHFEIKSVGSRWAEWLDVDAIENGRGGALVVGYSAEGNDGTQKRAAGVILRVDDAGRTVWRISDNVHSYSSVALLDDERFVVLSQTSSETSSSAVWLQIRRLDSGRLIVEKMLADSQGLDAPGKLHLEDDVIWVPFHSTVFADGVDEITLGALAFDRTTLKMVHHEKVRLDKMELDSGQELSWLENFTFFMVNNRPFFSASISLFDGTSNITDIDFSYRRYCFRREETLIIDPSDSSRPIASMKNVRVTKWMPHSGHLVFSRRDPCRDARGVGWLLAEDVVGGTMNEDPDLSINWPVPIRIGNIVDTEDGYFVGGSLEVVRPFKRRPHREMSEIAYGTLFEDRGDESNPRSAFLVQLSEDFSVLSSKIFEDQRSRSISGLDFDRARRTLYFGGAAAGGDSWLVSARVN